MWVLAPGARRRVFYFAAVISGGGEWEEVPQGISEPSRRATKTRGKIPEETGAELEGKFAGRRTAKSRQTSPEAFRAFRSTRNKRFFDNRKAGKPTPITLCGLRSARGNEGVGYYKFARD